MINVESIRNRVQISGESKTTDVLFKEGFKVIGLGFLKGQKLARHTTPVPAFLFLHEGSIEFVMGDSTVKLGVGDFIMIPANVEHEVMALEDSRVLLSKGN